jgi:hypothetical protein
MFAARFKSYNIRYSLPNLLINESNETGNLTFEIQKLLFEFH